jgi:GNAT superfamily N-acetyltransferase
MRLRFRRATVHDIPAIVMLWRAVNQKLGLRLGRPVWTKFAAPEGVYLEMRKASVYILRDEEIVIAVFTLTMQKPWGIEEMPFNPAARPLYLTDMAVHPNWRQHEIEQICIRAAIKIAKRWPCDALRLDTYDSELGNDGVVDKLGFRNVGTTWYRDMPSVCFELRI